MNKTQEHETSKRNFPHVTFSLRILIKLKSQMCESEQGGKERSRFNN